MAIIKRILFSETTLMMVLFVATLSVILLIADATQGAAYFSKLHNLLLPASTAIAVLLVLIIGFYIFRLLQQLKRRIAGSRLALRMVIQFLLLTVIPVATVYMFSVWLLEKGVDSWFDAQVEEALTDAVDLSRSSLDLHMRTVLRQSELAVPQLIDAQPLDAALIINNMLSRTRASEIALFDSTSRVIASGSTDSSTSVVPRMPGESVMQLLANGESYVGLDPLSDDGLYVRVVLPVPSNEVLENKRIVQFLYPITARISGLANSVQSGFGRYNELLYLRDPLKKNFIIILSLVLTLGMLFSIFAALYSARSLVAPIRELVSATKAVAAGEYHKKLQVRQQDDIGLLVSSFNQMTERLSLARDTTIINQRIIENQRTYLQTILEHLSSGILSLDASFTIKTSNAAANHILLINFQQFIGKELGQVGTTHDHMRDFCLNVLNEIRKGTEDWDKQIEIFTQEGNRTLHCRCVMLPGDDANRGGYVLVVDDVTALIQAQRDSAWGEVARRLAHEIKNPLTPIQLSAERIRRKLLPTLQMQEAEVLDRATHTIVQQVESLKEMVNDFSDYARKPTLQSEPLELNALVMEVVDLYQENQNKVTFELDLDRNTLHIRGDSIRLRQVIHNLIKNSIDALAGFEERKISISTFAFEYANSQHAGLEVMDNGPGFPAEIMKRAFEPYMTTKAKGNGLGLAIVKKIVEEHNGFIRIDNLDSGGAVVRLRFPLYDYTKYKATGSGTA